MVLSFVTNDPARFEQLTNFFIYDTDDEYCNAKIYIFDPWSGLGILDKSSGKIDYGNFQKGKRFTDDTEEKIHDLAQSLNKMDSKLVESQTIFILNGITPTEDIIQEKNRLIPALRYWATSKELIAAKSLVILIDSSLIHAIDDDIKNLIPIIEVKAGLDSEYQDLINYLASFFGISLSKGKINQLASALKGLNLHHSEAILRESYALKGDFDLENIKISKGDQVKKSGVLEVDEPVENFDVIGGYEELKQFISRKIIRTLNMRERADMFDVPLPRGILLFGPPGTGKTLFARALAKEIQLPFINFKTENIYSQFLGESGKKMKTAIRTAEDMSPAIIFIDEIDRFGKRTATTDSAGEETRRVFSQVLEWLGDTKRKAIIVGTTNRPDDLDEAFRRTGRFDYKIPVLYPDPEARLEILRIHLKIPKTKDSKPPKNKPPLCLSDVKFLDFLNKHIVPETVGYTGAELEELVIRAKRSAFEGNADKITKEDFINSLSLFVVDKKQRKDDSKTYKEQAVKYTDDKTFLSELNQKY